MKAYYDEVLNSSNILYEDFDAELRKENEHAKESEEEYRALVEAEENDTPTNEESSITDLKLNALSALLLDASNNRVLFEKDGFNKMAMASTTKIMTCIVTLENAKLDEIVTVSSYAAKMPDVQMNINPNEQYYLKDLLFSLMVWCHKFVTVTSIKKGL